MKKLTLGILGLALIGFSANAMAIGIGDIPGGNTTTKKIIKETAKVVGTSAANSHVKKENCHFTDATTSTSITCKSGNFSSVVTYLNNWRNGLEKSVASDVNVKGTVCASTSSLASKRATHVRNQIRAKIGYWDYYISGTTCSGDKISLSLSAR